MTNQISILSLNVCVDQSSTLPNRFNAITNNILNIKPKIIFFQELSLQRFTDEYHIISSCCRHSFEIYNYIPTIFLLLLSTILYSYYNNYYLLWHYHIFYLNV